MQLVFYKVSKNFLAISAAYFIVQVFSCFKVLFSSDTHKK